MSDMTVLHMEMGIELKLSKEEEQWLMGKITDAVKRGIDAIQAHRRECPDCVDGKVVDWNKVPEL